MFPSYISRGKNQITFFNKSVTKDELSWRDDWSYNSRSCIFINHLREPFISLGNNQFFSVYIFLLYDLWVHNSSLRSEDVQIGIFIKCPLWLRMKVHGHNSSSEDIILQLNDVSGYNFNRINIWHKFAAGPNILAPAYIKLFWSKTFLLDKLN